MNTQLRRYLTITLGACISGIALNAFFLPHHLLSGGITGLGMILYYLFGWQISVTNFLFNIPLFFLAYRLMSRHYIIGAIVQKFYSISISATGFLINVVLLGAGALLFGLEPALYTMTAYFVVFKVSNAFTAGFDFKKSILIVSEHNEEIGEAIIQLVGRGVTYVDGEGAYTHQKRKLIFCVVKLTQLAKIKEIVKEVDPFAFMIVQDANDVFGRGFTQNTDHSVKRPEELRTGWSEVAEAANKKSTVKK